MTSTPVHRGAGQPVLALAIAIPLFLTAATAAEAQHMSHDSGTTHGSTAPVLIDEPGAMPGAMQGTMPGHDHMNPPPAGVMGAHVVGQGKLMLMYMPMFMHMDGSKIGTRNVSPEYIVTNVPNRFDMMPMPGIQPRTLRIAPDDMSVQMHMFSAMYGITDSINLMLMTSYVDKRMTMITFAGGAGTTRLGTSEGHTQGIGDTTVALAFKLWQGHGHRLNGSLGVSLPTGSTDERGRMLSPMNTMMEMRSAYGMQLGTGTYDLVPSLTYLGGAGRLGWGAQWRGRFALEDENDDGYRWGHLNEVTAWISYALLKGLSATGRIAASHQGRIDGQDPQIGGIFQGTYPEFYGGERIEGFLGLNGMLPLGEDRMARLGVEVGMPLYQDLNGPQLARDWSLSFTAGLHF